MSTFIFVLVPLLKLSGSLLTSRLVVGSVQYLGLDGLHTIVGYSHPSVMAIMRFS